MKKTRLFLFTLCIIGVLALLVSCSGENYNEGFTVKTPERPTATAGATDGESTSAAKPTTTPTLDQEGFGEEIRIPTAKPTTPSDGTSNNTEGPATDATANSDAPVNSDAPATSNPTQNPTQSPVSSGTPMQSIDLPIMWF